MSGEKKNHWSGGSYGHCTCCTGNNCIFSAWVPQNTEPKTKKYVSGNKILGRRNKEGKEGESKKDLLLNWLVTNTEGWIVSLIGYTNNLSAQRKHRAFTHYSVLHGLPS